jgi:acyl-coenzyme A thioesterase PaaI-like protein
MLAPSLPRPAPPEADLASACFVCGPSHPLGLRIRYAPRADGSMAAHWTPDRNWEGFPGIVHGGIVSTILDEAMSKAVAASGHKALTAELKVRFRRPVPLDREVAIRGWILDRRKRRIRTEAIVTGADGEELGHAWGVFLTVTAMEAGPT